MNKRKRQNENDANSQHAKKRKLNKLPSLTLPSSQNEFSLGDEIRSEQPSNSILYTLSPIIEEHDNNEQDIGSSGCIPETQQIDGLNINEDTDFELDGLFLSFILLFIKFLHKLSLNKMGTRKVIWKPTKWRNRSNRRNLHWIWLLRITTAVCLLPFYSFSVLFFGSTNLK